MSQTNCKNCGCVKNFNDDTEFCGRLVRDEKTKTLTEMQNILKEKWYGIVTTIISVDRDEVNQSIEISVIPQS